MKHVLIATICIASFTNCRNPKANAEVESDAIAEVGTAASWDRNTVIGQGTLYRWEAENSEAQWRKVEATNIFGFKEDIGVGAFVQVVPLTDKLKPIQLKVVSTSKRVDEDIDPWYEIELEAITNRTYWEVEAPIGRRADTPYDLMIVFPPVLGLDLLSSFSPDDLPSSVEAAIVKGAVDRDRDAKPDALICEFCCSDRSKVDYETCEYICSETYLKVEGKWIITNSSQPM